MLELYGQRAGLADGQQILELGCGWGSLTLWMAERYPTPRSLPSPTRTASASTSWRSARRGLHNVEVITRDVNQLELPTHASTAASRWKCSSMCATTSACWRASASG
jgi:cyclopropane-fatty-acyl-phospholipid synthase